MARHVKPLPLALAAAVATASPSQAAYQSLFSPLQLPSNLNVGSIATNSVLNVRNFGAAGNGTTDDTAAFAAAIAQVNSRLAAGSPATLYIPAGVYYLNGSTLPTFTRGGSLVGDGPHKTYITLGPAYSGDVFSWSDAWLYNSYNGSNLDTTTDQAGPQIQGLTIVGSRTYSNQQNAFVFYDRDDMINMRDVQVFFLNGRGLYMGVVKNIAGHAYVRESKFSDLVFWACGTSALPAVEINSVGPAGDDATNELTFSGLDVIWPGGQGVVVRNSNAAIGVRLIRFFGLRVEGGLPGGSSGDLLMVGDPALPGNVNNIQVYGFEANAVPAGSSAVRLTAASGAAQPYNVTIEGTIPTSSGDGIHVDAGRQVRLRFADIYTPGGTGITVGPSSMVAGNIEVDGDGAETSWSYRIDPTSAYAVRTPNYPLLGDPSSGTRPFLAGPRPDGTAAGGNGRGLRAVDLQTARTSAAQVASGNNSVLLGGANNTASGAFAVLMGGASNTVAGQYGVIEGGLFGTDRGRYGLQAFASGNFSGSGAGDAQSVATVMRGTVASGGTGQLTSDGAGAGAANILNMTPGMAGTYSGYVTVRDTVAGSMYSFFVEFGAKRPGGAATTAVTWQNVVAKGGDPALSNVAISLRADSVNGGITVSVNNTTSPSGNPLHLAFTPVGAEDQ